MLEGTRSWETADKEEVEVTVAPDGKIMRTRPTREERQKEEVVRTQGPPMEPAPGSSEGGGRRQECQPGTDARENAGPGRGDTRL